jgi:hypothetical protein
VARSGTLTVALAASALAGGREPLDGRARAEAQATADLARRLGEAPRSIEVVELAERTWPDGRLGCHGRRMAHDPLPVPGFRMILALGEHRFVYHADRAGRVVACDRPGKPIDPIR